MNETELLRRFADDHDEEAFAELVRGKINLVYAAALRQVGGDAPLAQDVTQGVFIALACQAEKLKRHLLLTAWLYTTARNLAAKARREQARRGRREWEAHSMNTDTETNDVAWRELRPMIDDALHALPEKDRSALLLRFFEGRSQAEVGVALGLSENAARMRIERALEKLRQRLARQGITSTTAALGVGLASESLVAAPAGLAATVTTGALGCASAGVAAITFGGAGAIGDFMSTMKIFLGTAGAIAVFGVGAWVGAGVVRAGKPVADPTFAELRAENQRLRDENGRLRARATRAEEVRRNGEPNSGAKGFGAREAWSVSNKWKLMTELQRAKLWSGALALIDRAGRLNGSLASSFDLTPAEQRSLDGLVARASERIQALERANATVTHRAPNQVVIEVKPFPAAGGRVYDELTRGFAETLGPERNAAFVRLAGDELDRALGVYGAVQRTVTFTRQPDSTHSRYLAHDISVSEGSSWNDSRNFKSRDDLLAWAGTITNLLPPDF